MQDAPAQLSEIRPGIYRGISNDDYHNVAPGISSSGLSAVARSPAHYWERYLNPHRERPAPTPAMEFGTAVHTAVLEPERFALEYMPAPVGAPRRPTAVQMNAAKPSAATLSAIDFWRQFDAEHAGKTIMDPRDFDACKRVRNAVEYHPAADILLASGESELSMFWDDDGVLCKVRPDFWNTEGWLVDVKTTEDARSDAFGRSCWNYRYFVQSAYYMDGVAAATGVNPSGFIFLAIEKQPPYAIAVYVASPRMLLAGAKEYRRNLATYRYCRTADDWPAYPQEITPIDLPPWAEKIDARQIV